MIEWSEEHLTYQDALRRFIDTEIVPQLEALEHGDLAPYDTLRKLYATFGIDQMQRGRAEAMLARKREAASGSRSEGGAAPRPAVAAEQASARNPDTMALQMILIKELCRYCPGMVTAMGVSMGLTAGAIQSRGSLSQQERWLVPLLTLEAIGAWAITEPGSGSDAFGAMRATARPDGRGGYVLNGNKTFITNGPHADVMIVLCKLDDGVTPSEERKVLAFVLERGTPGLTQTKALRKMGLHSSPTGELFLQDVHARREDLLGETEDGYGRQGARETFGAERAGVVAMALGIVEQCLTRCVPYAKERVQFGQPIGEFQLVQLKLARMEVVRMNLENLLFRQIELASAGKRQTLAEASACKLYAAQGAVEVALEAVQLFGGNGYMAEYQVEQLCRDAKVLQIYAGTDEVQVTHIARDLLRRG